MSFPVLHTCCPVKTCNEINKIDEKITEMLKVENE